MKLWLAIPDVYIHIYYIIKELRAPWNCDQYSSQISTVSNKNRSTLKRNPHLDAIWRLTCWESG